MREYLLPVVLMVSGFLLILAEVFLLPGLITGIMGFLLVVWGIVYSYQHFGSSGAGIALFSAIVAGTALVVTMIRLRIWQRFVLKESRNAGNDSSSAGAQARTLVGSRAVSFTDLRPSGQVKIDGKKYDALAEGTFIPKGVEVLVVSRSGSQLVVTDRKPQTDAREPSPGES